MVKLGFSLQTQYACPQSQVIAHLHDAGFSAVSPLWSPELQLESLSTCVQAHNMTIQSLHTPHRGLTSLWDSHDPQSPQVEKCMIDCVDACAQFGIPIAVVHSWQGLNYQFPETPLDYSVFDRIVDCAGQKNISIAFENLEGEEYLQALMTRYQNTSHVGFCWDSGHDYCYPHKMDFLEAYGQRLIMTHINDNLGVRSPEGIPTGLDDLHFLPFDGIIPWGSELNRLKTLPKQGILNFEIKKRSKSSAAEDLIYDNLSPAEFFRLAGQRARKIAEIYVNIMV